jgi:hypothetical protein
MSGIISKSLRWDGSIIIEPRVFDLLKFFVPREGLRVSKVFYELLPWVVYTHDTGCGRVLADCFDLRRTISEKRLFKDLPIINAFQLSDGLCVVASLIGKQFDGKEGWLLVDGSVNVFLLEVGGQVLAISVSCLDDSGEFFVDEWWLLIDKIGPLRACDRIFSLRQAMLLEKAIPAHPPASTVIHTERRSTERGIYRSYSLGGQALQVYLCRHTVKRFRKLGIAQDRSGA